MLANDLQWMVVAGIVFLGFALGIDWFFFGPPKRKRGVGNDNVVPMKISQRRSGSGKLRRLLSRRVSSNSIAIASVAIVMAFAALWPELRFHIHPETLVGRVTHVRDGDTFEVDGTPIRLSGITCDELGTPLGERAKAAVKGLVSERVLSCRLNGDTTYDRVVGRCELPDGRDLGAILVERSVCGRCARFDKLGTYAGLEVIPFKGAHPQYCSWIW